jgi:hypothetical protein
MQDLGKLLSWPHPALNLTFFQDVRIEGKDGVECTESSEPATFHFVAPLAYL